MKKIVTHINPDLDAICSVWLIKRFLLGWDNARVCFVPAGQSLENRPPDENPEILHVDTGEGMLDHHQFVGVTSAAKLTLDYILKIRKNQPLSPLEEESLKRIVAIVTQFDNARDLAWPESQNDRSEFYLPGLIYGVKRIITDDHALTDKILVMLDGLLRTFKDKIRAEQSIRNKGIVFQTEWGKAIACETGNEKVLWEAEIQGYVLVIKYDPRDSARVKIYARFDSQVDLTPIYQKLTKIDPQADWFLHASKKLLLISKKPQAQGTNLELSKMIKLLSD